MPEFNNLKQAEAYYKEEAQAKAEGRDPQHAVIPEPEAEPLNTVFNPDPALIVDVTPNPETITESGSPQGSYEHEVAPGYDAGAPTPHPADLIAAPEDDDTSEDETPVAEVEAISSDNLTTATVSSDTPQE